MNTYQQRVTQITIVPDGQPIYSEQAWSIQIENEGGGEYMLSQCRAEA